MRNIMDTGTPEHLASADPSDLDLDLVVADLSGANITYADLRGLDLSDEIDTKLNERYQS